MSTDNKKLDAKTNDLLEDLEKNFGDLFKEYKKKKEEFKNQPGKLDKFLYSSDWRNKFRISTKSDEQWCKFFGFVKKTYKKVHDDNWRGNELQKEKASIAEECLKVVDSFCHLEKFQQQYKKVFDEWVKLDWQDRENKAGKSSMELGDQWQKLREQISDIGIDKDSIDKMITELQKLALENPNFDTMLKFCEQVKKLLDIDLNKYLLRNFDGFVEQFKGIFKEFEEAGYLKLDKWPEKSKKMIKIKIEEKDAEYWKDKINKTKHEVKRIEVKRLTDDDWKDFLWDNRMNFTHEQVQKLGFISDKDGNTDHFTLHRLADFVCFVPISNSGHNVVHDLRFFSFYTGDSWNWNKKKIEQLFKDDLDINVNKNLRIKEGTPVEYLFGYDVELLMKDIDKLKRDKKFDDNYYDKLVNSTHDKLVKCLRAIKPEALVNTVLSENSYVPNSAKDVYKKIDSKEKFNNMFGCYMKWSNECCDYDYLCESLYGRIKDIIGMQDEDERKKAIKEFVNSMSEKIFNFSKRNRESYLKQNQSSENINIQHETNRYALWSLYKIIIEITKKAEKEKKEKGKEKKAKENNKKEEENNQHSGLEKVISEFKNKWLAKFNSVLKIKDDEKISNRQLIEFMRLMYGNKGAKICLNELNLTQSFAEQIDDDREFEKDAIPSVCLIQSFLYDVFDVALAYLENSKTDVLENWKFGCAYKIINKLPKEWFSNRDNIISLLGYIKGNGNAKLLDNKFDGHFSRLNTGFGFFGFSKEQKKSVLDKIGKIRDECVFYAFISECIVYKNNEEEEVDIETLQIIIEKTEIYGLGLRCINEYKLTTIDDRIYDKMKKIVELVNESDLEEEDKKKVFKNISDLYFNKFCYSNDWSSDNKLFGVKLDEEVFQYPENSPTKADIICEAIKKDKIDKDWFCKFLENSITLACCNDDKVDKSAYNVKEALYANERDMVDILLDPVKFEFCKKKYRELKPDGKAFNSFDTIENAIQVLHKKNCKLYWKGYYKKNEVYFKECKAKVLAVETLNIDEDKRKILESIKAQIVKHGLCWFSSRSKEFTCYFNFKPANYFWTFDKGTQKQLIKKECQNILKIIDNYKNGNYKGEVCLEGEGFSNLLSLAEESGNLDIFLENDLAIKLFDVMHDEFNDVEFNFYQKMISVDKNDTLLRHILTKKRIHNDKESKDKRLPIYRFLISNDRKDIKSLKKQSDDAYDEYSEAYDDWEQKNDELEKQEQEEEKKTKNIEQMRSEVAEADKKQKELYKDYEAIDNKIQAMRKTLTEDDKNKLNKIAKDLLANIRENKGKNEDKYMKCLDSAHRFLANLLNEIKICGTDKGTGKDKNKKIECNFFDIMTKLKGTQLFSAYISALYAIKETETEFDKTAIRDLFIEFIDFQGMGLLDSVLEKEKIDSKTLDQLKKILRKLGDFYNEALGMLCKGLSQNQSNAVVGIFVNLLDRIKSKDIEVFSKLTRNMPLQRLIADKNCKLDANLVDKIKKLFDKNQEKPKENQDTKKDINKKDGSDSGNQMINELKTEPKDTENMQSKDQNENNKVEDDNNDKKELETEKHNEDNNIENNKSEGNANQNLNANSQDEINDNSNSNGNNKNNMNEQSESIKNEMLQNVSKSNENNNREDNTNRNLIYQSGFKLYGNNQNLSTNVSNSYTTTGTDTQNLNVPFDNMNKKLNPEDTQISTKINDGEQNESIEKETAKDSNTSQKMEYVAPVGSTFVSIASWSIFAFVQAELLLIAAIIFTLISLFLWARKIYTDKIKKEEPPTVSSPQKNPEGVSINNNFLQQYQDMKENGKTIRQEQQERSGRNEAE